MITRNAVKYCRKAFTLVELLLVMAVMLIVMGFVVVAFPNIGKAGNLTNGAAHFVDQLNLARQLALAQNRVVEVRFYYLPGPTDGSTATAYRAMRIIVCNANGETNLSGNTAVWATGANAYRMERLPNGVIIFSDNSGKFTTLLPAMTTSTLPTPSWPASITTSMKAGTGTETFPGGTLVSYAAFRFKPNGGTSLDPLGTASNPSATVSDKWFISFKNQTDAIDGTIRPAKNFVTVMIDPISGRARSYRP